MTARQEAHYGIAGVDGREPIGAALSVGRKGPRGNPVDTDRLFLVAAREGDDKRRPMLPQFAPFNDREQAFVRGNLVHEQPRELFEWHLKAIVKPGGQMHPDRRPFCTGDGATATRWMGGEANNYKTITCPNERCEFRASSGGKPPACRPWMRFLFRLRWPEGNPLPTPLVKYTSQGWETIRGFVGLMESLERARRNLGAEDLPLFGYPITLTLSRRTKPSKGLRYPVVDVAGEVDPVTFFAALRARINDIRTVSPVAAITDERQQTPEQVDDDYRLITPKPQGIGAATAAPVAAATTIEEETHDNTNGGDDAPVDDGGSAEGQELIPGWD